MLIPPIVEIIVVFLLSLAGAFVLFKWLDATAVINKPTWQAGGSLAGFILIFVMLHTAYIKSAPNPDVETWMVVGNARLQDRANHDGIEISIHPAQQDLTRPGGDFRLPLEVPGGKMWPELYIHAEGHFGTFIEIDETVAEIDRAHKRIRLKEPVLLERQPAEEGFTEEIYTPAARLETGVAEPITAGTAVASLLEGEVQ